MKATRWFTLLKACLVFAGSSAFAHPLAQGALDIQIFPDKTLVQAHVSGEEIFLVNALAKESPTTNSSLAEIWRLHGEYLLQHLKLFADEKMLSGAVLDISASQDSYVIYQLQFTGQSSPARLRFEEDILNEIQSVPGNQWEAAYMVRIQQQGHLAQEGLLLSHNQPLKWDCDWKEVATPAASAQLDKARVVKQYIRHGIAHILSGYDHLLFIGALVLAAMTVGDLIKVVTAFTLAHTLTLTLSVLNLVRLPSHVVEPMIAGSIVFVAASNLLWPKRSRGWMRLLTAFFFGLFHGLGFAGGLLSATEGMTGAAVGLAIASFSIGVELGHQMVVLPLFCGLKLARATQADHSSRERLSLAVMRGGSLLIAIAGSVYLISALR